MWYNDIDGIGVLSLGGDVSMAKFCSNCGGVLEDNAVCTYCNNTLNDQNNNVVVNNNDSKKKVRFHWEIPFIIFIQWILVWLVNFVVNMPSGECLDIACEPTSFESIMNVIRTFSTILCTFTIPSLIAVIIVYVVQKGKKD